MQRKIGVGTLPPNGALVESQHLRMNKRNLARVHFGGPRPEMRDGFGRTSRSGREGGSQIGRLARIKTLDQFTGGCCAEERP